MQSVVAEGDQAEVLVMFDSLSSRPSFMICCTLYRLSPKLLQMLRQTKKVAITTHLGPVTLQLDVQNFTIQSKRSISVIFCKQRMVRE